MPLTPLHLAVGLPLKRRVSIASFIIVNLVIDLEVAFGMFFNMDKIGYSLHGNMHTFGGATVAVIVTLFLGIPYKGKFRAWLYGALLGAYSHILLDALVHSDVQPFAPLIYGNPMFLDLHAEVSLACAVVLTYYLVIWVESLHIGEVWPTILIRFRGRFSSRSTGK